MENEIINKKILKIWEGYPDNRGLFYPMLYPEFKKNTILFVGCNPSDSIQRTKNILNKTGEENADYLKYDFYNEDKINQVIKHEVVACQECNYFKKFIAISKEVTGDENNWDHIDLFYYRKTSQKEFKKVVGFKEDKTKNIYFNEFGENQLKLFFSILKTINPKVIVVANSFVSKIINNRFKDIIVKPSRFEEEGFDRIIINDKEIPIFFTSMLTGQRAFDNYSYKRLIWHIKQAIK